MFYRVLLLTAIIVFNDVSRTYADGYVAETDGEISNSDVIDTQTQAKPDTHADEVARDKRLPSVLPGEEIVRNGKRMKVWSTTGPVPSNPSIDPAYDPSHRILNHGVGIIVDERSK
jgi:hypothetical protein